MINSAEPTTELAPHPPSGDAVSSSQASSRTALWRAANAVGVVAIVAWLIWWGYSLYVHELLGAAYTWIHVPVFGADFYSQSDMAARQFMSGIDPYASRGHLFHYPPLVIRSFLWTPYLEPEAALRIWIVVLGVLVTLGTWVSHRIRKQLDVEQLPFSIVLAAVLFSFPVVFQMERSNFDLLTLAAMLLAYVLFNRGTPRAEFIAGCLLAVGPWVKLYPGLMGLGLVALRRWKAVAGFVVAGIAIFLAAPAETIRSFESLQVAVERVKNVSKIVPMEAWGHSLSVAWLKLGQALSGTPLGEPMLAVPGDAMAGLFVLGLGGWVGYQLFKLRGVGVLMFPLLLWLNALGSCVGAIANDYSLIFLPMAIVSVTSLKDSWFVRISMLLLVLWWQPIDIGIPAVPFLIIKVLGLVAVGVALVRRAQELASAAEREPSASPARSSELRVQPEAATTA